MGCIFFLTCFCFYCKFPRTKYHLIIALMLNFQALGPPPRTLTALDPLAVVNKQKKKTKSKTKKSKTKQCRYGKASVSVYPRFIHLHAGSNDPMDKARGYLPPHTFQNGGRQNYAFYHPLFVLSKIQKKAECLAGSKNLLANPKLSVLFFACTFCNLVPISRSLLKFVPLPSLCGPFLKLLTPTHTFPHPLSGPLQRRWNMD